MVDKMAVLSLSYQTVTQIVKNYTQAGSALDPNSLSHFLPWPDFKNFSRFLADL
jgi:hypothetical protein